MSYVPLRRVAATNNNAPGGAAPPKKMSEQQYMRRMERLLTRMAWMALFGTVAVVALLAVILGLGVGAYKSGDMMTKTTQATIAMHEETLQTKTDVTAYIERLKAHFPSNQDAVTMRQILGTVENVHKISERVERLLSQVEPETVTGLVTHLGVIAEHVEAAVARVDESQVQRLLAMADHVQELVAGITPAQVSQMMGGLSETAQHAGALSKEAEETHAVGGAVSLFAELKNTLGQFNAGHRVSVGWGQEQVTSGGGNVARIESQ